MAEDNTVFVLQKALMAHKAKVTKDSVKEFLLSHPRYPSQKSVCDGLKKWNIDHYPLKLSKEEILEIEPPYIAHVGGERGQLALVEKIKHGNVIFTVNQEKKIVQSREEFSEKLSGGVIVMEPDSYQQTISMSQHIADEYGEENVYSIAFTSSEREIESETEDFVIFPETTWEGRFAKKYEKDYAFIDLIPIRESEFGQKQFESTVFGRPILGKWYNIFDGYFFIRRMEFSTYDFN